jgi:uncharacterized membrane protein
MYLVNCNFLQFAPLPLAEIAAAAWIPGREFWPYFSGVVLLVIGLPMIIRNELPPSRGLDKVLPLGRLFFAIPMAVFGTEHFVDAKDIASIVPPWLPAHTFFVYLIAIPAVFFGVEHFLHPENAPGVPLSRLTPMWIPGRLFWAYLAGTVLVAAGGVHSRESEGTPGGRLPGHHDFASRAGRLPWPIVISQPSDIGGLNYFVDTTALSGASACSGECSERI